LATTSRRRTRTTPNEAKRLTRDLRNVAAHGSDQVLLNLGYPDTRDRLMQDGSIRNGRELAVARVSATVPVLEHAVLRVSQHLAQHGIDHGLDDSWFLSLQP
jgi:hypothetical protein